MNKIDSIFAIRFLSISVATLAFISVNYLFAASQESQSAFPREVMPYNKSFGEWTNNWWSWLFSMPEEKNAMNDETGVLCAENQNDSNVWYLTGGKPSGNLITRQCDVPFGKALFFADANECNHGEYPEIANDDIKGLEACAVDGNKLGKEGYVKAFFDGKEISNIVNDYNITSGPFDTNITKNFIFPGDPGLWNTMSNAYVLFLKPPSKGPHQLDIQVLHNNPGNVISYNIKYNLSVK
jgi:hypothetical protein